MSVDMDYFEEYVEGLPTKQREAVENLQIFLEENFTDEEINEISFYTDRDEEDWYIWVCELHGRRFNLVYDYEKEEVERVNLK